MVSTCEQWDFKGHIAKIGIAEKRTLNMVPPFGESHIAILYC